MGQESESALSGALARLAQEHIPTVSLQFTDLGGHIKGVSVPGARFAEVVAQGQRIDGSSIDSVVRLRENDMLLRPDLSTLTITPAAPPDHDSMPGAAANANTSVGAQARVICDVCEVGGQPFVGDPRAVLRRAIQVAAAQGYTYRVASEVEFYVCQRDAQGRLHPLHEDRESYFDLSADQASQFREALSVLLQRVGIGVESSHHEVGAGQHEIDLAVADAMQAADALVTLKQLASQLARRHGVHVSFMPKPFNGQSGSGLHLRQSLTNPAGDNLFVAPSRRTPPELALRFIAGQLRHAAAFTALTCPHVNSYKRLASGYEAPATISWAHVSRAALIRVPLAPSNLPALAEIELRGADPSCSPYLALAAALRAGLAGIAEGLIPPEPMEETIVPFENADRIPLGVQRLPLTLGDALGALGASALMSETLGEYAYSRFLEMKRREWQTWLTYVTDWEQDTDGETA